MATEGIMIPVIDLAKFEGEKEKLMAAVSGPGCFRVINHGIPEAVMVDIKAYAGYLFELPSMVKQRISYIIPGMSYTMPNLLTPVQETLGIYDASSPTDVHAFCSLLDVPSQDREILSTYTSKIHGLIVDLASKIAEVLGIMNCSFKDWPCHLALNKYNFTKETIVGSYGAKIHTDSGFITVLLEDESNGGLEIMDSTGNFVAIEPEPRTFLVNIGDIGKVWSNGRLHNVKHRVLCKKTKPRIIVGLFMHAPKGKKVEPRAELIDSDHPQLYQSFDYMEYRDIRFSTLSLDGEVLLRWAVDEAAIMD